MPKPSGRKRVRTIVGVIGLLCLVAFMPGSEPARADSPSSIQVVFLNETGQTANDLHVTFNVDMMASIISWAGQGVSFPASDPTGTMVDFNGADVADQNGTTWNFTALVPEGTELEVVSAYWTYDDKSIGAATYHYN